jgi:hypothetical protein
MAYPTLTNRFNNHLGLTAVAGNGTVDDTGGDLQLDCLNAVDCNLTTNAPFAHVPLTSIAETGKIERVWRFETRLTGHSDTSNDSFSALYVPLGVDRQNAYIWIFGRSSGTRTIWTGRVKNGSLSTFNTIAAGVPDPGVTPIRLAIYVNYTGLEDSAFTEAGPPLTDMQLFNRNIYWWYSLNDGTTWLRVSPRGR